MFIFSCFVLAKPKKEKEIISFRFVKHNMSSKIVGWLVGARDGKILGFKNKIEIRPIDALLEVLGFTTCSIYLVF